VCPLREARQIQISALAAENMKRKGVALTTSSRSAHGAQLRLPLWFTPGARHNVAVVSSLSLEVACKPPPVDFAVGERLSKTEMIAWPRKTAAAKKNVSYALNQSSIDAGHNNARRRRRGPRRFPSGSTPPTAWYATIEGPCVISTPASLHHSDL